MFIGIVGTECSGKSTIKEYLVAKGFLHIKLANDVPDECHSNGHLPQRIFESESSMLSHATQNWREDFVTTSLRTKEALEPFMKRPFFLLVVVDAPIILRWRRSLLKRPNDEDPLERFLERNDRLVYGSSCSSKDSKNTVAPNAILDMPEILHDILRSLVHVSVINSFHCVSDLHAHLDGLNLMDTERLRPGWDSYFMTLAHLASLRSNCMKRRVGAILVRNNRIVATGYNGTPRGLTNCNEGGCSRCNGTARSGEALDECLCLHAEENALLEAGRERVGDGAVLYCNTCPCLLCSVKIVQTGIRAVVYNLAYSMDDASAEVFRRAGVALRQHCPPP